MIATYATHPQAAIAPSTRRWCALLIKPGVETEPLSGEPIYGTMSLPSPSGWGYLLHDVLVVDVVTPADADPRAYLSDGWPDWTVHRLAQPCTNGIADEF